MSNINANVEFFMELSRAQAILSRRFDSGLGGLGLTEFMILQALDQAENEKMRRVDLADKVGLTPSGITRLLAPMEKVGLIKREAFVEDARVSHVMLASGGKRKLTKGMERAEMVSEDLLEAAGIKTTSELTNTLKKLSRLRF